MGKRKQLSKMNLSGFGNKEISHGEVQVRCRILIVCEGEKTEPNYFRSFDRMKHGSVVYDIDCQGGRINTIQVVNKAIELRDKAAKAGMPYDAVWAVFDKDDFPADSFNAAILKASQNSIGCAWSNEAFELWYVLHFVNRTTPMHRADYQSEITRYINGSKKYSGHGVYSYAKNDPAMRTILTGCGDEGQAIRFSERLEASFSDHSFHTHNPCTTVYKLVRMLRGEDEDFNKRIIADMES